MRVETLIVQGTNPDVTTDPLFFQFVPGGLPPRQQPADGAWYPGYWMTQPTGVVLAAIDVGPSALRVPYSAKPYAAWIKIVDYPDTVIEPVDTLAIY